MLSSLNRREKLLLAFWRKADLIQTVVFLIFDNPRGMDTLLFQQIKIVQDLKPCCLRCGVSFLQLKDFSIAEPVDFEVVDLNALFFNAFMVELPYLNQL